MALERTVATQQQHLAALASPPTPPEPRRCCSLDATASLQQELHALSHHLRRPAAYARVRDRA